jgi:hypothetical protein
MKHGSQEGKAMQLMVTYHIPFLCPVNPIQTLMSNVFNSKMILQQQIQNCSYLASLLQELASSPVVTVPLP